jgi:hypothetical protein
VKLNPTLLGYDKARGILDLNGFPPRPPKRESFEKDLQWHDAKAMLRRLSDLAAGEHLEFGLKLTNDGSANTLGRLPRRDVHSAGRCIPLRLRRRHDRQGIRWKLPISYCAASPGSPAQPRSSWSEAVDAGYRHAASRGYEKLTQIGKRSRRAKTGPDHAGRAATGHLARKRQRRLHAGHPRFPKAIGEGRMPLP